MTDGTTFLDMTTGCDGLVVMSCAIRKNFLHRLVKAYRVATRLWKRTSFQDSSQVFMIPGMRHSFRNDG